MRRADQHAVLCAACRFADYKDKVIDLLMRVTIVSVHNQKIVEAMKTEGHLANRRRGSVVVGADGFSAQLSSFR